MLSRLAKSTVSVGYRSILTLTSYCDSNTSINICRRSYAIPSTIAATAVAASTTAITTTALPTETLKKQHIPPPRPPSDIFAGLPQTVVVDKSVDKYTAFQKHAKLHVQHLNNPNPLVSKKTRTELNAFFSKFGPIAELFVATGRGPKGGYATVQYYFIEDAEMAYKAALATEVKLGEDLPKIMDVKPYDFDSPPGKEIFPEGSRIFLEVHPESKAFNKESKAEVKNVMSQFGEIRLVKLNPPFYKKGGYGHIQFFTAEAAAACVAAYKGKPFIQDGRHVHVMLHNPNVPYVNKNILPKEELERMRHKLSVVGETFLRLDFKNVPSDVYPYKVYLRTADDEYFNEAMQIDVNKYVTNEFGPIKEIDFKRSFCKIIFQSAECATKCLERAQFIIETKFRVIAQAPKGQVNDYIPEQAIKAKLSEMFGPVNNVIVQEKAKFCFVQFVNPKDAFHALKQLRNPDSNSDSKKFTIGTWEATASLGINNNDQDTHRIALNKRELSAVRLHDGVEYIGQVIGTKMLKTVKIVIEKFLVHPKFQKMYRRSKKIFAHDEHGICTIGDIVRAVPGKKRSDRKKHVVVEIIKPIAKATVNGKMVTAFD